MTTLLTSSSLKVTSPKTKKPRLRMELIRKHRRESKKIKDMIMSDDEWGFNRNWRDFIEGMTCIPAQSYGSRIQNRYMKDKNLQKSEKLGDCVENSKNKEFKCSLLTRDESLVNIVQIRLHEKTDYIVAVFDLRSSYSYTIFKLTHEQMQSEVDRLGNLAHGKKERAESEFRISMAIGDSDWTRWNKNYKREIILN